MLTSRQRAFLRREAQSYEPILQVGKSGVTESIVLDADAAVTARELVKGSVLENSPVDAREAADALAEALGADVVQVIGRRFVLFRQSEEPERRHFDIAKLSVLHPEKPVKKKTEGTAAKSKKKTVKPGYKKIAAKRQAEEERKIAKAEKAAYFREKAREERRAEQNSTGAPIGASVSSSYKVVKGRK